VSVVSAVGATAGTGLPVIFGVATGDALSRCRSPASSSRSPARVLAAQGNQQAIVTARAFAWALVSALGLGTL
jgi:hypothetical protein